MTPTLSGVLGLVVFLIIIMMLRMPIAYAMAIVGFAGYSILVSPSAAFRLVSIDIFTNFASYSLTVVPMFIFMGFIALYSGVGGSLFSFSSKFLGHFRGGLALATQAASALFGAISGSMLASVATIGSVALPEMRKHNYNMPYSAVSIAAGSSLGSLIPPSVILIVYGIATEQSIGRLFAAGVIPGIVHMSVYMITIIILTRINPSLFPLVPKANWEERIKAFRAGGVIEVLIVFAVSLGGLFLGWFTPTEAGAVGAFSLLLITLLEKKMDWPKTKQALAETTKLTAMIFLLVVGATILGRFLAVTRIPFDFASMVMGLDVHPFLVMIAIVLINMVLGCVVDAMPLILLTIPVFFPVIVALGFDPIWFGIVNVVIVSMGSITPPVGMSVYIVKGCVPDVPLEKIFRAIGPFLLADWTFFILLLLFPAMATFLPGLLF